MSDTFWSSTLGVSVSEFALLQAPLETKQLL